MAVHKTKSKNLSVEQTNVLSDFSVAKYYETCRQTSNSKEKTTLLYSCWVHRRKTEAVECNFNSHMHSAQHLGAQIYARYVLR